MALCVKKETSKGPFWTLYILSCADGTLYTGITTNLKRRLAQHNAGKGARYTRGRGPLALAFSTDVPSQSHALRLEQKIKKWNKKKKLALISGEPLEAFFPEPSSFPQPTK